MRITMLLVALGGIGVLFFLLWTRPIEISNFEDLESLEVNQRVVLSGMIINERVIQKERILQTEKNITLICECNQNYKGKKIELIGSVEEYGGKKEIRVLRIRET